MIILPVISLSDPYSPPGAAAIAPFSRQAAAQRTQARRFGSDALQLEGQYEVTEAKRLKQLEEDNAKLKEAVGRTNAGCSRVARATRKKMVAPVAPQVRQR